MLKNCLVALYLAVFLAGCSSAPDLGNLHVVEPGVLIRSAQPSPIGFAELRDRYGVKTVINLNTHSTNEELVVVTALGLDYLPLPIDTYGLQRDKLIIVLAAIRQAQAEGRVPVLVHCRTGQDRTGAAVATYRVLEQDWSGDKAKAEMERYRHWTHELVFPHIRSIPMEAERSETAWTEAIEQAGEIPIIRPAASTRPSGVLRATTSGRPSVF